MTKSNYACGGNPGKCDFNLRPIICAAIMGGIALLALAVLVWLLSFVVASKNTASVAPDYRECVRCHSPERK